MHDAMAVRVMRAPVGWFERTPLGRILNRFSSDIQEIDKDVMEALGSTLVCTFSAVAILVVISYTVGCIFVSTAREANLVLLCFLRGDWESSQGLVDDRLSPLFDLFGSPKRGFGQETRRRRFFPSPPRLSPLYFT